MLPLRKYLPPSRQGLRNGVVDLYKNKSDEHHTIYESLSGRRVLSVKV